MLGGIIGSAVGAIGGIFGGISKNKMLKKQAKMIDEKKRENQDWFDRRYNEDATQRADAQAMLTHTADLIKQRNKAAAGSAAVAGGTEESVAATKEANAKTLADATSQIAVAGEQRKDRIEGQYMSKKDALDEQLRGIQGAKQDGFQMVSNATGGAVNGFVNGLGLSDNRQNKQ